MPYFDHNATAPLHPIAREAWLAAADKFWQNPGGPYRASARAHAHLDDARERLARHLSCVPGQIVFTSGATESINMVIAVSAAGAGSDDCLAVSGTEHPAVREAAGHFWGDRIAWLGLDGAGRVDEAQLTRVLQDRKPPLTAVMAANNETGVCARVDQLAEICRVHRSRLLCDATQWIGKLPPAGLEGADFLVGGAHKFGGPKGVGFLRLPAQDSIAAWLHGGRQEGGRRAGTENLPSIHAMVAVLEHLAAERFSEIGELENRRRRLETGLQANIPGIRIVGGEANRLWNTVSVILPRGENTWWVQKLDHLGFEVSTGSACASGSDTASHVLSAMGWSSADARRVIRISAGWDTKPEDWDALGAALVGLAAEQADRPVIRTVNP